MPGENEDKTGRPFVGPAGQLLDRIIAAAGWKREDLYITNIVKCRPHEDGKNMPPTTVQIAACMKHLTQEIEMVKPKIILCLGTTAAATLIHPKFKITEEHGCWFEIKPGVLAMAIYHPSYILHKGEGTPEQEKVKLEVWDDIQLVIEKLKEV